MIHAFVLAAVTSFSGVKVQSVYDGDTFTVTLPGVPAVFGESIGIRIEGMDTAELKDKRACAKRAAGEAQETLRLLLNSSEHVDLIDCQRDKFFRLRCAVRTDSGLDVSAFMITSGFAVPYSGATRPAWRCRR